MKIPPTNGSILLYEETHVWSSRNAHFTELFQVESGRDLRPLADMKQLGTVG